MSKTLEIGQTYVVEKVVTPEMSAARFGNPGVEVLATPWMIGLIEDAAFLHIASTLSEGQGSVGTHVDVRHLAATPIGMKVTITVEVIEISGKRINFKAEVRDESELVGAGTHERYILDSVPQFLARIQAKSKA